MERGFPVLQSGETAFPVGFRPSEKIEHKGCVGDVLDSGAQTVCRIKSC